MIALSAPDSGNPDTLSLQSRTPYLPQLLRSRILSRWDPDIGRKSTLVAMDQVSLDSLLDLEETYYQEGYQLGVEDGLRTGRIEGRLTGLQKGFEKYVELAQLSGCVVVWQARVQDRHAVTSMEALLPALDCNSRLQRHLEKLHMTVDAETLSTQNTEEAVSDFDDRLKRAVSKVKVIEKLIGEGNFGQPSSTPSEPKSSGQKRDTNFSIQSRDQNTDAAKLKDF